MVPFLGLPTHEQPGRGIPRWLQEGCSHPACGVHAWLFGAHAWLFVWGARLAVWGARLAVWRGTFEADSFASLSFLPFSDSSFFHLP